MEPNYSIGGLRLRTVEFVGCFLLTLSIAGCSSVGTKYEAQNSELPHSELSYAGSSELNHRFELLSDETVKGSPSFYEYLVKKADVPTLDADQAVLRIVFEERVFFDTGRWNVRRDAASILQVVAASLRKSSKTSSLFVAGHTDSRGDDTYNLDLSIKRADSVAQALLRLGVGNAKIWRVGFGKAVPLKENDTVENMAINRRVEFIVSDRREAIGYWLTKQGDFLCFDRRRTPT
jgi:outer membrane protein OmpA-like peptidoglycan-associated protein